MRPKFVTALVSVTALVAAQLTVALTTGAAPAAADPPPTFDCYGNTIYSVAQSGSNDSKVYALDTQTLGNATVSATEVTSIPGQAKANAFGISRGGSKAAVVAQTSSSSTTVSVHTYTSGSGWTQHTGTASAANETFVAGAIDPSRDIYYYANFNGATGKATVYGFDLNTDTPINGVVATITLPLTGSGTANGDMAFDLGGNLYLVESFPNDKKAGVAVVKGQLPTTAANASITSTRLQSYTPATVQGWNGIAFDNYGHLYIEYSLGTDTELQQLNPNTGTILAGPTKQNLASGFQALDLAACSLNPTLTVKAKVTGRSYPADQFGLSITGGSITQGNTATTDGTTTQDGVETNYAGPVIGVSGTSHTISQTSTTGRLANYDVSYRCTDAASNDRVVASGNTSSFTLTVPAPDTGATGPYVTCLFTDTPTPAALTTTKSLTKVNGNPADASTLVKSGDVLTYALTTVNSGGSPGTAQLTDVVPVNTVYTGTNEGWSCAANSTPGTSCGQTVSVAPSGTAAATVTKNYTVTVSSLPANTTTVSNVASASGATCTSCTATNQTAPVLTTTLDIVTVNAAAATSSTVVKAGDVVVYRATTTNTGGSSGSLLLSNPVPSRTTYTGSGQGWSCAANATAGTACDQNVTVPAGGSVSKSYTVTVGSTSGVTAITDTVGASAGTCTGCSVSNPTPADLRTTLAVSKVNGAPATTATPVKAGDVVTVTVTVANAGGSDGTTTLSEQVAANTTYHGASGETWSCATGSAANSLCTQDVTVAGGQSATRTYTAELVDPLPSGTTQITDAVTSGTGTCTACSVANPTVAALDSVLTLTTVDGDPAGPATTVKAGDVLGYTLTTTNTGGSSGTTTLTQTVPANSTYTGTGWTCPSGTGAGAQCTRDVTVAAGSSTPVGFEVTLGKPLPADATTVLDSATSGAGTCSACSVSNAITPTFATTVGIDTVNGDPAASARPLAEGDDVVYSIRVTNPDGPDGDVEVTNVVPADSTFTGTGWSCPTGSPAGTTCTKTVTAGPGSPAVVPFEITIGTLADGVVSVVESVSVSAGSCAACTVTNPTVAKLSSSIVIVTVNGQNATLTTAVGAGDVVVYRTTTTNAGGSSGTTTLTDTVPSNSSYTGTNEGWTCNPGCTQDVTVPASDSRTRDVTVTIGAQDPGTTSVTDTLSSTVGDCTACTATNPTVAALSTTVSVVSVNGRPATAATPVKPGDTIGYLVTVSNTGGSAGSTTIGNPVPAHTAFDSGDDWSCATGDAAGTACTQHVTVQPGLDVSKSYVVTVADPLPAGTASITDAVTSTSGSCSACSASNPTVAVVDTTLVLATKNGQPAATGTAIAPGDVLGYRVTVTNTGGTPVDVTLGETVPTGTTYTGTGWTCTQGGSCSRTVTATPGTPAEVDFEVTAADPFASGTKKITDAVTADLGTCSDCQVDNPTVAHLETSLTLATVNGDPYVPGTPIKGGDVLGYKATVTNTGGSAGSTDVTDTVPQHTSYTGTGEGWSCSTGDPAGTDCTQNVGVPSGDSTTVDLTVTVDDPLPPGTTGVDNNASSSAGDCPNCNAPAATAGVLDSVLTLAEVNGDLAGPTTQIPAGAALHYTVTVTNTGGTAVTTTLTETIPAHTTYVGVGEGWTCSGTHCTHDVTVQPGVSVTVDYTVQSADPIPSGVTTIGDTVTSSVGTCSSCAVGNPTAPKLDTRLTIDTVNGDPYAGAPLKAGDVVGYLVTVENTGGSDGATTVTQTVPQHSTYTGGADWTCNGDTCTRSVPVTSGATETATFEVTIDTPVPDGTQSVDDAITTATGTCSSCRVTTPLVAQLDTVLEVVTVNGDSATAATQVASGDEIGYRMTVTNSGGASATTTLTQTVPANTHYTGSAWTCTDGGVAGASCTRDVTVGGNDSESVTFAVVVDDLPAGVTTVDDGVESSTGSCSACAQSNPTVGTLSVSKRVTAVNGGDVAFVGSGEVITYTITAVNSGGSAATTMLTDTVPAHASYTGTGEGWSCATGSAAGTPCSQSVTVAAGDSRDVTFTMTLATLPDGTGSVSNTVESSAGSCTACTAVSYTASALHTSKQLATVNGSPAATGVHVRSGDVLGYRIVTSNTGGAVGLTLLTENVPAHTRHTGRDEGWTCSGATCSKVVAVLGSRTVTSTFTVTVGDLGSTDDRDIVNAIASTSGLCSPCSVATTIARADLSVTKTADRSAAAVGDRVAFTVRVHNAGPDEARGVAVADDPTGLRLVSADAGRGRFTSGTWTIGSLPSGGSTELRAVYTVTGTDVSNVATIGGHREADPTGTRNRASVKLANAGDDRSAPHGAGAGNVAAGGTASTGIGIVAGIKWALLLLVSGAGLLWLARRRQRIAGRHRS